MKQLLDIVKEIFRGIWIIFFYGWVIILLQKLWQFKIGRWFIGVVVLLVVLFIGFLWWNDDGKPVIKLSTIHAENNQTEKFMKGFSHINRELHNFTLLINYQERNNIDFNKSEIELVELDKNKTTYETIIFEGDLNSSIKTFHRFWIVQLFEDDENHSKILLSDINTTFPIHIYKTKNQKWATIKTEILDNRTKAWIYKEGKYIEDIYQ